VILNTAKVFRLTRKGKCDEAELCRTLALQEQDWTPFFRTLLTVEMNPLDKHP